MSRDHTCINHPSRTAVARCRQCNSPICPECAEQYPAGTFCSKLHAERYLAFGARQHEVKKSRIGLYFWLLVLLLTACIVGIFAAHYAGFITLPFDLQPAPPTEEQFLVE